MFYLEISHYSTEYRSSHTKSSYVCTPFEMKMIKFLSLSCTSSLLSSLLRHTFGDEMFGYDRMIQSGPEWSQAG